MKSIDKRVTNSDNVDLIKEFFQFMKNSGTSESYQRNNLKVVTSFSVFHGAQGFSQINNVAQILSFLDSKIKTNEQDPDGKWRTTWNDYLSRLEYFFRWLHNVKLGNQGITDISEWVTPDFVHIIPYLEPEIWDRVEIQKIIT